jgi:FemAB-related protein (PEP-CTERM system-associated)
MHGPVHPLRIRRLEESAEAARDDAARWDAFVEQCPDAGFFHLSGWQRAVRRAFGHRTHYLFAEREGRVVGVLPLAHVRSRLFGNALISNAFCVEGGPAADDPVVREMLTEQAVALADDLKVDYLEYRCPPPDERWHGKSDLYVRFAKPIDPDVDANMKAIPRKQRAMVRKGIKAGLTGVLDEGVDRLHHIYAISVRNLGTPVFSKRYFRILTEEFADRSDIVTILHEDTPVASVMNFYFRDRVLPFYGGATLEAREWAANDFMYWEVMRRACERGYRLFDFGRSKVGTGAYGFKKHWGFPAEPLTYGFYLRGLDELPNVNPTNPKYRLMISAWRKLPLGVSKLVGPPIARNLG